MILQQPGEFRPRHHRAAQARQPGIEKAAERLLQNRPRRQKIKRSHARCPSRMAIGREPPPLRRQPSLPAPGSNRRITRPARPGQPACAESPIPSDRPEKSARLPPYERPSIRRILSTRRNDRKSEIGKSSLNRSVVVREKDERSPGQRRGL